MKLIRLKGGTYCDVFRYKNKNIDYVIKIFGEGKISKRIGKIIISDYINLKSLLEKLGVKVPKTYKIYYSPASRGEVVIIEQFCGTSLRELLRDTKISSNKKTGLIKLVLDFMSKMPEGIPLDVNPGNLVVNKKEKVTFVDFIPPEPWKYRDNILIQEELNRIFPKMKTNVYRNKYKSYHINKYRKERFLYHCNNLLGDVVNNI